LVDYDIVCDYNVPIMARGFPPGCTLPNNIRSTVLKESTARKGTCTTCGILGAITRSYRSMLCSHMKWSGKYIKKKYRYGDWEKAVDMGS